MTEDYFKVEEMLSEKFKGVTRISRGDFEIELRNVFTEQEEFINKILDEIFQNKVVRFSYNLRNKKLILYELL